MSEKKKIFPKLKKKLENFLTDESGEITKKDALGVAAGVVVFSNMVQIEDVEAILNRNCSTYQNQINSLQQENNALRQQLNDINQWLADTENNQEIQTWFSSWLSTTWNKNIVFSEWNISCTVSAPTHVSWVVNGHISSDPSTKVSLSHGSHNSHSSGGWC